MTEPFRVHLSQERQARALASELAHLSGLALEGRDGAWEVTVSGVLGDKLVVRVLNAVSRALDGDSTARVFLIGHEYVIQGE